MPDTPDTPSAETPPVPPVPDAPTPEPRLLTTSEAYLLPPAETVETLPEARAVTKARAEDLRALLGKYIRRHLPETPPPARTRPEPPRLRGSYAVFLPLLKAISWVLLAGFGLSFFWDFPGLTLVLFGEVLPLQGLLRILSVSGLIGFGTNWLAITMLFNPRERRPLLGQGLIPAQRERVIYRLASSISKELINAEIIKQKIQESAIIPKYRERALHVARGVLEDPDFRAEFKTLASNYVETVLTSEPVRRKIAEIAIEKIEQYAGQGLGGLALRAYRYFNEDNFQERIDQAIRELPSSVDSVLNELDQLLDRVPALLEARADETEAWATQLVLGFVENLDVYAMIMEKMSKFDDAQLEDLLKKSNNEQLNYITYLGGILGVVGGLVIWQPVQMVLLFGMLGLAIWGLDVLLYRLRRIT
jgi:uncharacterized membrane protein YheB (UPF0754 family)